MGPAAAREGDPVVAMDNHIVMVPVPGGTSPSPLPHPFNGRLEADLSPNVSIDRRAAGTVSSVARNVPGHVPTPPGTSFANPPRNEGTVQAGSTSVFINDRAAARLGDPVLTCNDPPPGPPGRITGGSTTVFIG